MKHPFIYVILVLCILLFSGCCTFRNYAPFSEPVAALDSGKMVQVNSTVGLFRFEGNIDVSPVNHLGISATGGAGLLPSARSSANSLQIGAGYFDAHDNQGVELFGGWGLQNFHAFHDTCNFNDHPSLDRTEYLISDTLFQYNYFFLRPAVWWSTGTVKFIASVNLKGLGSGNYQFYMKKYYQYSVDTMQHDISVTQYEGPLRLLLIEPSLQLRLGRKRVRFLMEGKYSIPVMANINISKYFSPSKLIFTAGIQLVFHQHDLSKIFHPHF